MAAKNGTFKTIMYVAIFTVACILVTLFFMAYVNSNAYSSNLVYSDGYHPAITNFHDHRM